MALRCLVLSDDRHVLGLLERMFQELGITSEVCTDCDAAAEKLLTTHYEAVLLDCDGVPGAPGLLQGLHSIPVNKTSVAVAIVDPGTSPTAAFQMGATFVLNKPFSSEKVMQTLRAAHGLMMRERRRYYRCALEIPVKLSQGSRALQAMSSNLSEEGIALRAPEPMPVKTELRLRFVLTGGEVTIRTDGQIAWADVQGLAGVNFIRMSPRAHAELDAWLAERLEEEELGGKPLKKRGKAAS